MADERCELLCLDLAVAERLRKERVAPDVAVQAAALAGGLADPTRLALAATLLDADELCVCDLSWILGRSDALVSHHARLMRARGLLRSRREGKMVLYSLTEEGRELLESVLTLASRTPAGV